MQGRRLRWATAALALYAATAWVLLGCPAGLTTHILGIDSEAGQFIWCLAYLPWAIAHHQFSPVTHLLWQPYGVNLAWLTTVPLLGLLMAPVTLAAGPLLSFNLLTLAAPALAGWAAYFLCLELCEVPAAAMLGGFLFAFSSYEAAQSLDHLNLDFTALLPLILLAGLRRVRGRAGRGATAFWLGLLLGGEFLISPELLATACLFGGITFLLAYAVAPQYRPALRALALDIILAAPLALLLAAPVLLAMAKDMHEAAHPQNWTVVYSIDALNFLLPTPVTMLGGPELTSISNHFTGGPDEQAGYLGLPALLLLGVILADAERRRRLWLPLSMLGVALLAALGPVLQIGGHNTGIPLPWALIARLPLLGAALPARCMVYAFLALAIITSLWLRARPGRPCMRAAICICVFLLPAKHAAPPAPFSSFFRPGRVQQVLGPQPNLLILPFSLNGPSSIWQAESGFSFTQTGGYLGLPPAQARAYPVVITLLDDPTGQGLSAAGFAAYVHDAGTQYVIAGPGTAPAELAAVSSLGWPARQVDDVTVFTVPAGP
jgi:Bacterial membrane protein YfhO